MGTPAIVADVVLDIFGGRVTDVAPSNIPEGISPDNEDVVFYPGGWNSRPGLARRFPALSLLGAKCLYVKEYVKPNGDVLVLFLDDRGRLYFEDTTSGPGSPAVLNSLIPAGLYAQSVSAFGREYFAFSDLVHGEFSPLQYDGHFLDRVTQDGPGAPPSVADEAISQAITAAPNGILEVFYNVQSGSQTGNIVTLVLSGGGFTLGLAGNLLVQNAVRAGQTITLVVAGVGAGYNGSFTIASVVSVVGATITVSMVNNTLGLPPVGAAGTCGLGLYKVTPTAPLSTAPVLGNLLTIAGASVAAFNATWTTIGQEGNNPLVIIPTTGLAASGNGTVSFAGRISPGLHQIVQMFLTREGAITAPSPIASWTSAGTKRAVVSGLAIGPANVVARIIGLTGAGGGNFFFIPSTVTLPGQPTVFATVVPDNTTSTVTLDFSDNSLMASIPIDVIGNDLFDQIVLGPVRGFFSYASRLAAWGEYNKVENFVNMGLSGGFLALANNYPLGWTVLDNVGASLINGGTWAAGLAWQVVGNGSPTDKRGYLTQNAKTDSFGNQILLPSTQYSVKVWLRRSFLATTGNIFITLSSASTGYTSTVSFPVSGLITNGKFTTGLTNFSLPTPAVIPDDFILSVYVQGLDNAQNVAIAEIMIVYTYNPYRNTLSRWSYVNNPEGFAGTTGNLGPSDDDSNIQCFALQRQITLLETEAGIHSIIDNNEEPGKWPVNEITRAVGAIGIKAGDPGKFGTGDGAEDWTLVAGENGIYLFAGADFWKVSQEISRGAQPKSKDPRKCWDDINWTQKSKVVIKNDPSKRRAYFAVPLNEATTPNVMFVLDYREMDTATQIASAAPLHITMAGKMKSSDLTRKWSVFNLAINDINIVRDSTGGGQQLCLAGGVNDANLYALDPAKLTDDDYGAIGGAAGPFYTTYAMTDKDNEQALGIGSDMHLVKHIHLDLAGIGMVTITPLINSIYNIQPALTPRLLVADTDQSNFVKSDIEWTNVGLRGQRIFFRIGVRPLPGTTDVQIRMQKMVVGMMRDPILQFRQSAI